MIFKFCLLPGIQSDSEESTNYHTINHTYDVTNGVLEATSQTEVINYDLYLYLFLTRSLMFFPH